MTADRELVTRLLHEWSGGNKQAPQVASSVRIYLAWVLERRGEFSEVVRLLREAVDIGRRMEGSDGPG